MRQAGFVGVGFFGTEIGVADEESFAGEVFNQRRFLDAAGRTDAKESVASDAIGCGSASSDLGAKAAALLDAESARDEEARREGVLFVYEEAVVVALDIGLGNDAGLAFVLVTEDQIATAVGQRALVGPAGAIGKAAAREGK